jgi:antitoxin (DNA-binding transcriptional repressor) of toxin-antitoxin stability system
MTETPLWQLLREAGTPGASTAVDQLAGRLAEIGAAAPVGGVAPPGKQLEMLSLMPLAYRPRLLVRLDERSRDAVRRRATLRPATRWWHSGSGATDASPDSPWYAVGDLVAAFDRDPQAAGQIAVAFAATDPDGRRRERAIAMMADRRRPEHLPFLVLRCDDWARQVHEPAAAAMTAMLRELPEHLLRVALPMAAHLAGRRRGGTAMRIIEQFVEDEFELCAPILLRDHNQRGRRLAFAVGTRQGRWSYPDLLGFAAREPDLVVRLEAATTVCREAVRRQDAPALRDLATVRFGAVRSLALAALSELGHDGELAAALTDPAPLIRAFARSRTPDPADRYRTLITSSLSPQRNAELSLQRNVELPLQRNVEPSPQRSVEPSLQRNVEPSLQRNAEPDIDVVCGAILGLAEMGDRRDAGLLASLLTHPEHRVRATAVRGLAMIDSLPVEEVLPLLTDPARDVVRAASVALRVYRRRIPPELPWTLLADARPEVRLGGFRLLTARTPIAGLLAALRLAADPDEELARRGRITAIRLIPALAARKEAASPLAERLWPDSDHTPVATLPELLEQARPHLGRHYDRLCAAVAKHYP